MGRLKITDMSVLFALIINEGVDGVDTTEVVVGVGFLMGTLLMV